MTLTKDTPSVNRDQSDQELLKFSSAAATELNGTQDDGTVNLLEFTPKRPRDATLPLKPLKYSTTLLQLTNLMHSTTTLMIQGPTSL